MTAHEAFSDLAQSLTVHYDQREAANIADWVMENITGKKRWERRTEKIPLTIEELNLFDKYKAELLTRKPVQYVLNEAFFCGYKFILNENVLIPRPETEELVRMVIEENTGRALISILDIGTGSGCIPILLKKKLPGAMVTTIEVSEEAIKTAKENAKNLDTDIDIRQIDFLDESKWELPGKYDIIISNPPYIPEQEKELLNKNVVDYEPGIALFVPETDPLIFYRKIEKFSRHHLKPGGKIYLETHEKHAKNVLTLFIENGWSGQIIKDMFGKDRIVRILHSGE